MRLRLNEKFPNGDGLSAQFDTRNVSWPVCERDVALTGYVDTLDAIYSQHDLQQSMLQ